MHNTLILNILSVFLFLATGCKVDVDQAVAKPTPVKVQASKVLALGESAPVDDTLGGIVPEIESRGFARTRTASPELTPEQQKVADRFAAALSHKPKRTRTAVASKPQPMAHMQSSVPLQWMSTDSHQQAMQYGRFGVDSHKSEAPEHRDVRDEERERHHIK